MARVVKIVLFTMAVFLLSTGVAPAVTKRCDGGVCKGTIRADRLHDSPKVDKIYAGRGADRIYGGVANDLLNGGAGKDAILRR